MDLLKAMAWSLTIFVVLATKNLEASPITPDMQQENAIELGVWLNK